MADPGSLSDVCNAIKDAIPPIVGPLALSQVYPDGMGSLSGQPVVDSIAVFVGWPTAKQLAPVMNNQQTQITVYPRQTARNTTRFKPVWRLASPPMVTLGASVLSGPAPSGVTVTFSGVPGPFNVHTHVGIGSELQDAYTPVLLSDTLPGVATKVAGAINGLAGPTATPSGVSVVVSGASSVLCEIGGMGYFVRESQRRERQIQITVWSPFPTWRTQYMDAILAAIGTGTSPFLSFGPWNAQAWVRYDSDWWVDQSQSDYGVYEHHALLTVEYPVLDIEPAYQVGATIATLVVPSGVTFSEDVT